MSKAAKISTRIIKPRIPRVSAERTPAPVIRPIGVFDSGIGGLTVTAALRNLLPAENLFYLGDTARVPYGGKSQQTIERYSTEITGLLLAEQAKIIVVACNTASALAIPRLESPSDWRNRTRCKGGG